MSNRYRGVTERLPKELSGLCEEFSLEPPALGERWEFTTQEGEYDYDNVRHKLIRAGCELCQNYRTEEGRRWEYIVPEPGWPDPLGYVTAEEPQWVASQHGWRRGRFYGNVRGTIPDVGDCDRHPNLPPNAYALTTVYVYPPEKTAKYHAKTTLERPDGSWAVNLTYEQSTRSSRTHVAVYSSRLGEFPECTEWRSSRGTRDERRRVEFFENADGAFDFVEDETGLTPDRTLSPGVDRSDGDPDA